MSFDIDNFLLKISRKLPFLKLDNQTEQMQALIHFSTSALWASSFAHLCKRSHLFFLSIIPWIGYVLYKELILDGHLKRLIGKTETNEEKKDFISDLVTKLSGLSFYGLVFI